MKDRQSIYRPTSEQLKLDKQKEAHYYLMICVAAAAVFYFFDVPALIILLPLGFFVIYLKYLHAKKNLRYRCIRIKVNMVSQEAPGLHDSLKDFTYGDYGGAHLSGEHIYLNAKTRKTFWDFRISFSYLNVEGYPDKEKIAAEINARIQQYRK